VWSETHDVSRRTLLKGAGATLAGMTVLRVAGPANAFPGKPGEGAVIPWLDVPAENPVPDVIVRQLDWEKLDSWLTPPDQFFVIKHYDQPDLREAGWSLGIDGLVARPQSLTLADLKARARGEVDFTMECSGNSGLPFFIGGVGNARWAGARLAPLLERAGVLEEGIEVVFWGADAGAVTIRDNSGIIGPGSPGGSGKVEPDTTGGLDLTITEHFARSMSLDEALNPDNLLCYEMNGAPLPPEHGFPVRLIAPGWYGVANVKWLTRIEVMDRRYRGRFMARDYITIREPHGGETAWTFHLRWPRPAQVGAGQSHASRRPVRHCGCRLGAPIAAVEVKIDDGPWMDARLKDQRPRRKRSHARTEFAWAFWTFDWGKPAAGEHTIASRAFDIDGHIQPAPDDTFLASKVTYWESNGQITRRVLIPGAH
jgi:DMSO/TMAO reductase YedYZ molybdopterin-dependent catalytic subunit